MVRSALSMPSALSKNARLLAIKLTKGMALMSAGRPDNRLARAIRSQVLPDFGKEATHQMPATALALRRREQLRRGRANTRHAFRHHQAPELHSGGRHPRQSGKNRLCAP